MQKLDEIAARPTSVAIRQACNAFDEIANAIQPLTIRCAFVSSFTFDPVVPFIRIAALRNSIRIEPHVAPYGQFEQEFINPQSALYEHSPDVCLIAIRLCDQCPRLYDSYNSLDTKEVQSKLDEWFGRLEQALTVFRSRSEAPVLILNYESPVANAEGIAESPSGTSQRDAIRIANDRLKKLAGEIGKAYVMDYDSLVARHGRATWSDPRTSLFARIPIANHNLWPFSEFFVRYLRPLVGKTRKVLVLDADNTLWGGVSGDVGPDGIALGNDFPGNAFVSFQRRVLDLHRRGVVLCMASKNEMETVTQIIDHDPRMILRRQHFSAMQVNWERKPDNLRKMAELLNLGIDSFVFIDDSPIECEMMRQMLPEVLTIQLPEDPAHYPTIIESLDVFDQLSISNEDRRRGELYREEAGRRDLQTKVVDLESFYQQLQTRMTLFVDHAAHKNRAAQLCNRTNQFNMNTIRYTESDIAAFMSRPDAEVITLHVSDRFGDSGIVGLAIVNFAEGVANVHVFLMSCRVLGRTVEQCFFKWIANRAASRGCDKLTAEYAETEKNKPFR